jgi:hypothetical protein
LFLLLSLPLPEVVRLLLPSAPAIVSAFSTFFFSFPDAAPSLAILPPEEEEEEASAPPPPLEGGGIGAGEAFSDAAGASDCGAAAAAAAAAFAVGPLPSPLSNPS